MNACKYYSMQNRVNEKEIENISNDTDIRLQIAAYCEQNKLAKNGLHHEIYLSDFRRTPSEKLKTILREPVK